MEKVNKQKFAKNVNFQKLDTFGLNLSKFRKLLFLFTKAS